MAFCSSCGAQIPAGATSCPACAHAGAAPAGGAVAVSPSSGLTDNVAGMLAYVTIIPAIIFLVMEPYNRSKFIRSSAFSSPWRGRRCGSY